MANLFFANEIIKMNIQEEHNGAIYYNALSESARNDFLRKRAGDIAKQELVHKQRFQELLDKIGEPERFETYPGEYEGYIDALLQNKMFPNEDAARKSAQSKSDLEAVEFAMQTERNTLLLLNELRKHIDDRDLKYVDITIEEEQEHLVQLNNIRQRLAPGR